MPLGQFEFHPYHKLGESIIGSRMILGTFPVYCVTRPGTTQKFSMRNGSFPFFYGSSANNFWKYYKQHVDPGVNILSNKSLWLSLKNHQTCISDVVLSCCRIGYSPADSDLRNKNWNLGLSNIITNRIDKIICTSKGGQSAMGWLTSKILMPAGYARDLATGRALHNSILSITNANVNVSSVAEVYTLGAKSVSLVSIPSPGGSGVRQIANFGYRKGIHLSTDWYLNQYLTNVFQWF